MSASLVGSEMCIRDRPWSSNPQGPLACTRTGAGAGLGRLRRVRRHRCGRGSTGAWRASEAPGLFLGGFRVRWGG
eukprot:528569-Alexandrium_andersonii.AAC.1